MLKPGTRSAIFEESTVRLTSQPGSMIGFQAADGLVSQLPYIPITGSKILLYSRDGQSNMYVSYCTALMYNLHAHYHSQDPKVGVTHTASHSPADEANGLAAVGESIQFEVTSTNTGNVEVANATTSNEMFKNDDGEWGYRISVGE